MKKSVLAVSTASGAAALVAATVLAGGASNANAAGSAKHTLTFAVRFDEASLVVDDVDPAGDSAGDRYVFAADLLKHGKVIGRLLGASVAVDATYQGVLQSFTLLLPGGSLEVQGGGTNLRVPGTVKPAKQKLSVVGGTGRYAGVTGTYATRDLSDTKQKVTVTLVD